MNLQIQMVIRFVLIAQLDALLAQVTILKQNVLFAIQATDSIYTLTPTLLARVVTAFAQSVTRSMQAVKIVSQSQLLCISNVLISLQTSHQPSQTHLLIVSPKWVHNLTLVKT